MLEQKFPIWFIVVFSLLVHLPGITSPLLDYHAYRQCQTASMARNYARHGMHFFNPELDTDGWPRRAGTEFPLYSYLLAILFKIFGIHEILGRILSAIFAAWGAVYLYRLVCVRIDEATGFWSALAISVIPVHLYFTRSVQPEPMALWGLLGFAYYADQWFQRGGGKGDWCKAILTGAIAPLLKLPFLYVVLPLWFLIAFERDRWRCLGKPSFIAGVAGILAATAGWYHYAKSAPVVILPLTSKEHWENLRPLLTWNLYRAHFISRFPELCTTYSGLLFGGFGVYALQKQRKAFLWLGWFFSTAAYIILLGNYGLIHRYTELPFAPIDAVFIGAGWVYLYRRYSHTRQARAFLVVLLIGMPVHAALRIAHWYHLDYPWVFRAQKAIAQCTTPGDLVITNTTLNPVLLYYVDRYGFSMNLDETGLAAVDEARARGANFLLTPTDEGWAKHPEWQAYFSQKARLVVRDPDFLIFQFLGTRSTSAAFNSIPT